LIFRRYNTNIHRWLRPKVFGCWSPFPPVGCAAAAVSASSCRQVGYDSLQGEYPTVAEGREYARLGKVFWETYRGTLDIDAACADAAGYADDNRRVVVARLTDGYCDYPNRSYAPEDVCPFTENWATRLESYFCSRVISCGCRSRLMLSEPTMLPWSAGMAGWE